MTGPMVCPECPECGHRSHYLRFDTDEDVGVLRCDDCDATIMMVSVLANKQLRTVKDPMAGELPEGVYYDLEQAGRLPEGHND